MAGCQMIPFPKTENNDMPANILNLDARDVVGIQIQDIGERALHGLLANPLDEAQARYIDWKRRITPEVAPAFADLVRAWDNWTPWILGYFDHPVTNAYTESLNSLIRVMNRLGRGYSFEALRAKILFAEGAHKHKNSRPRFERKAPVVKNFEVFDSFARMAPPAFAAREKEPKPYIPKSTETPMREKNYGADISTLIRMIENGEL